MNPFLATRQMIDVKSNRRPKRPPLFCPTS